MSLIFRTWNITRGLAGIFISYFERRSPEALLDVEKENLRKLIGQFNEGLVSHAALSERLLMQVSRGEEQAAGLAAKTTALVKAGQKDAAARYALQLKEVSSRLAEDRKQLETAEETYRRLVRTRETAVAEARDKIEQVRRQIGDLKVKRALADLESMASMMIGGLGSSGDSLNRLQEMVDEERQKAAARVRVAGARIEPADLLAREAEQDALAKSALEEFLHEEASGGVSPQLAIPDYTLVRAINEMPAGKPGLKISKRR